MAGKPADYFLGLHDFFALLLPGVLLTAWLSPLVLRMVQPLQGAEFLRTNSSAGWVAFFLAAFVIGQVLFTAASALDYIADPLLKKYRPEVEERLAAAVPRDLGVKPQHVGTAWLRLHSPAAMGEIDRATALSKFYRSLSVVFATFSIAGFARVGDLEWKWDWAWEWMLLNASLAIMSFGAYVYYRHRHRINVLLYLDVEEPGLKGI